MEKDYCTKRLDVTPKRIYELILLSYHVLEITKKQKVSTLLRYLNRLPTK